MRKRLNRVLSAALSAVMLLSLWPTAALAAPTSTSNKPTSEQSLLTEDSLTSTPAAAPSNGDAYTVGDDTVLQDGMEVVIYNPAYKKTLSGVYDGFYNTGTDITIDGATISGFSTNDVWTVSDNNDGTWSFAYEGQKIGMGDKFSSMPLGEKHNT